MPLAVLSIATLGSGTAMASGPRWVTGPPYFTTRSQPVVWYTTSPLYFTDRGDLSASVDHAAADALVAAAAGVWNVPTSRMVVTQGGELAEHVSSEDVYLGTNGLVFPADVSSANYAAIQIAVIYDSDGSVTDLLLGQGASDPENCSQAGVTESVDAISRGGMILHALLILNGRCTGALPEQQLQMQYQLMRAFGRVLGLGWSQTNDNVFTGSPVATSEETMKWPIMHPIDIVCGAYTYQCLPDAFTLRPDDVASISELYFIAKGTATAGKADTLASATAIAGTMHFRNEQGMQGMNLLARRADPVTPYIESGPVVSAMTGSLFRWSNGNPVTGPEDATVAASIGNVNPPLEGEFRLGFIPLLPNAREPGTEVRLQDIYVTSEAINPLYTGEYGIGPYLTAPVSPSGPAFPWRDNGVVAYEENDYSWLVPGSAAKCVAGVGEVAALGTDAAPIPVPASGWWTGVLCGYGAAGWSAVTVKENRSVSVEVTALDEQGLATENKAQPVIGVWNAGDLGRVLPTVAATGSPFNSIAAGLTLANFNTPGDGPLRIAVADQRGDGRPDYGFGARLLYADAISPASVGLGGGLVTVTGMGFRPGLNLMIGGAPATVMAATATTILAIAPAFAELGLSVSPGALTAVDVGLTDGMSGGSTAIYGGLTYPAIAAVQGPSLTVLTPAFYMAAGRQVEIVPEVGLWEAGSAAGNMAVTWSAAGAAGTLVFGGGGQSVSDGNGIATIAATIRPLQAGAQISGEACAWEAVCGRFAVIAIDPAAWTVTALEGAGQSVGAANVLQPVVFQVTDGAGDPVIGAPMAIYQMVSGWQACPAEGRCPVAPVFESSQAVGMSDANGLVVVTPQQLVGVAEVTAMAVAAGTHGFATAALQKAP